MTSRLSKRQRDDDSESEPEEVGVGHRGAEKSNQLQGRRYAQEEPGSDPASDVLSGSDGDCESGGEAADIPLGELVALKQDGSTSAAALKARAQALRNAHPLFKRKDRHRPSEQSSKKPVPVLRDAVQAGKREIRDPRFDALTGGKFVEPAFKKRYAFLYDEKLPQERRELAAAVKRSKKAPQREELQARLARVTQDLRNEEQRRKRESAERAVKVREAEAVAGGKRPFYLKRSEKKRQELVARYEELKASGGLEKYMTKRRKRNAAKDHRYLPSGRRGAAGEEG